MHAKKINFPYLSDELLAVGCVALFFLVRQFSSISIDLNIGDEGIVLMAFKGVFQGDLLYRDVWCGYGPIAPYIFSVVFHIFGMSVLIVRYASTIILLPGVIASYFICRRFLPVWWSAAASLMAFLMTYQPLYSYSHIFSLVGGLFTVLFLLKFCETVSYKWLFWSGFLTGISLLEKPFPSGGSMALAVLLALVFFWIWQKEQLDWSGWKIIWRYGLGALIITLPVYFYFFLL